MKKYVSRLIGIFGGSRDRRPRLALLAAFIAVLAMYGSNSDMGGDPVTPRGDGHYRPVLARGDGHLLYLMARSTALDGDWSFDNDLARFGDPWRVPTTPTGRKSIIHPIGVALVWTPLIWTAELGAVIANVFGADIELHGYTLWHQRFVFLSSVLCACGTALLGWRLASRLVGGRWAPTYAACAVLLGTSLTYYATYMPSYSHALDSFASSAFIAYWAATVRREDLRRWAALGGLLGFATLISTQELALGVVVLLECVSRIVDDRSLRSARFIVTRGAMLALVLGLTMIPQIVEWELVFGRIGLPQGPYFTRPTSPMVAELLWSPRNGWFSTTPLAYLGVIGVVVMGLRRRSLEVTGLLVVLAIQLYLNSIIMDWWSGSSFGQRRLCNVSIIVIVGISFLLSKCSIRRLSVAVRHAIAVVVLGAFVYLNLHRVNLLQSGQPAPDQSVHCGDQVPDWSRAIIRWVCARTGSPFELPASAIFAIRHGVPITQWDAVDGLYPITPGLDDLAEDRIWKQHGKIDIGQPAADALVIAGLGPSSRDGSHVARAMTDQDAALFVPNLMPTAQRMSLYLDPNGSHVRIAWNGDEVAEGSGSAWIAVPFTVAAVSAGTNELGISVDSVGAALPSVERLDIELVQSN